MRCTFNLTPCLVAQLLAYEGPDGGDRCLDASRLPADGLTEADALFLLDHFFLANPARLILPHPRYAELYRLRSADQDAGAWPWTALSARICSTCRCGSTWPGFTPWLSKATPVFGNCARKAQILPRTTRRRRWTSNWTCWPRCCPLPPPGRLGPDRTDHFAVLSSRSCRCCSINASPRNCVRTPACPSTPSATQKMRRPSCCGRLPCTPTSSVSRRMAVGPPKAASPRKWCRCWLVMAFAGLLPMRPSWPPHRRRRRARSAAASC